MALPKVEQSVIENVEQAEMEEARAKAVMQTTPASEVAPAVSSPMANNPMETLAQMGFTDLQIDFTSFPTIVLNKGIFKASGGEKIGNGTSFEFVIMDKRKTYLYRGIEDRDSEPELAYSDDMVHINLSGGLVADKLAEWESKGWQHEMKEYFMVMAKMVGGDKDGEIIQLQIPKTSIGRFDGYLVSVAMAGLNPKSVVTRAQVGEEVGKGTRAFTPWDFKRVK